jgi:hypothetical protein
MTRSLGLLAQDRHLVGEAAVTRGVAYGLRTRITLAVRDPGLEAERTLGCEEKRG